MYDFKRQVIKGTKDRMSEKDELGYVHERYAQYYKGIKIEHSDVRVRYLNDVFVSANGEYIDAPNIDISVMLMIVPNYDVRLYDGSGNLLRQQKAQNGIIQFNVTNLSDGFYYLHIYDGSGSKPVTQQILVKH